MVAVPVVTVDRTVAGRASADMPAVQVERRRPAGSPGLGLSPRDLAAAVQTGDTAMDGPK